ncbi:MAG TPA: molecular chaperone HscC, partial [Gammaproteobacteria bacterium]|nr:molecular chaperone HscC [Gammaproteobacteria bacterium]
MGNTILGIDLGTTNSLAAIWRNGHAELIPNSLGETLTPSAVGLSEAGDILVGRAARERLVTHPQLTAAAFKRYMGSDRKVNLGDRGFRSEELSALVLKALKEDAEHFLGEPVSEAVISVPAYFNDTQRKATRVAGELAGLDVGRLINEPTAAALAYGLHQRDKETRFLVFDLGGGTFDVSILELFEGVMEVHASAGDNALGGEDFVDVLVDAFLRVNKLGRKDLPATELNRLRAQMEKAKRALNQEPAVEVQLRDGRDTLNWTVTQADYEKLSQPLLDRLRGPVERALRDSGMAVGDIDEVVLVGGSTRKMIVQKLVARMFGRLPLRQLNPDEVVARGAAVQAVLKARDGMLKDVVLTDVCPYSLGIETGSAEHGQPVVMQFEPIIERNTIIPASRMKTFYPLQDYQPVVTVKVYQGESRLVADNVFLGHLDVRLPRKRREDSGVDVRFTYDINGLLEVETRVLETDAVATLVIEQTKGAMTPDEIRKRLASLAELKLHPRNDVQNQAILNRANRLYEELLGSEREQVGTLIGQFMAVLEEQDPQAIQHARAEVDHILDQLE